MGFDLYEKIIKALSRADAMYMCVKKRGWIANRDADKCEEGFEWYRKYALVYSPNDNEALDTFLRRISDTCDEHVAEGKGHIVFRLLPRVEEIDADGEAQFLFYLRIAFLTPTYASQALAAGQIATFTEEDFARVANSPGCQCAECMDLFLNAGGKHRSDCGVHNMPAQVKGGCSCR